MDGKTLMQSDSVYLCHAAAIKLFVHFIKQNATSKNTWYVAPDTHTYGDHVNSMNNSLGTYGSAVTDKQQLITFSVCIDFDSFIIN